MKTAFLFLIALTLIARGQNGGGVRVPGSYSSMGPTVGFDIVGTTTVTLKPRDQLRIIGNNIFQVIGESETNGWVEFQGKVLQVHKQGIRVRGTFTGFHPDEESMGDFFVANFPYEVAEGDTIGRDIKGKSFLCAKVAGVFNYNTVGGTSRTIRKLDYGEIYIPPPPTAEQIAAHNAAMERKKKETQASTIKWLQDQAAAGDAFSQFRLGERYLKGDGVETNEVKAVEFFTKASAQGNEDAREALKKLANK